MTPSARRVVEVKFPTPLITHAQITDALERLGVPPDSAIQITTNLRGHVTKMKAITPLPKVGNT